MECFYTAPDCAADVPFRPTDEQCTFISRFYRLDTSGARIIRRGVLSRPKGWGKSPILGAIAGCEGLAPVLFDHWAVEGEESYWGYEYEPGEPVGRPWRDVRTPLVQLSAVSEDQTRNAWTPLLEMLSNPRILDAFPGLEPMQTFINLPGGGRIEFVTASARSREGNRPVFCVLDQTETWLPSNGGVKLAATMRRNLGKTGGSSIESPNAYLPGEESVAEASAEYWAAIREGKAREDKGLLYDHREAPADTELTDRESLMAGLHAVYGDSAKEAGGWVDLERIISEVWDPATDPQDARRFYLNQITHASDSYVSQPEWAACAVDDELHPGDLITLGFDGSRGRAEGKPDATALVATRVEDGFQYAIGVWEASDTHWDEWTPPLPEIDAAVDEAFRVYDVAAFYCDPAKDWRSFVAEWEKRHGGKVRVKSYRDHPFEWWFSGRSVMVERMVREYAAAIRNGEMKQAGQHAFTRHMLNARLRKSHGHLTVGKASTSSPNKIDAAVAGALGWQARLDCIAAGIGTKPKRRAPVRVY